MSIRRQGAALITTLMTIVIVAGIALLMFNRTLAEMSHSRDNVAITQTMMLARGGANAGGAVLSRLRSTIEASVAARGSTTNRWTFGGAGTTSVPNLDDVAAAMKLVAQDLQAAVNSQLCSVSDNFAPTGSSATVTVRIHFTATACGQALPANTRLPEGRFIKGTARGSSGTPVDQLYAIPFVMVSEARQAAKDGEYKRNIVVQGEFQFSIGRGSFAQYAYFVNERKVNGNPVFFSNNDMIDGPVHSNEYLRYWGTPWFGSKVTVAGCVNVTLSGCGGTKTAGDFFNGSSSSNFLSVPNNTDPAYVGYCGTITAPNNPCPTFEGGVDFSAGFIGLPTNNFDQRAAAQSSGLRFTKTLKELTLETMKQSGDTYQVIRTEICANAPSSDVNDLTCSTPTTLRQFRYQDNGRDTGQPLEVFDAVSGTWKPYFNTSTGEQYKFQGVVFTDGGIANLGGPTRNNANDPDSAEPALADFAQITIATTGRVVITKDLQYEDLPCEGKTERTSSGVERADCNNLDAKNVLGIYSQKGDVLFGTGESDTLLDLTVHATIMSSEGRVGTNNWNTVINQRTHVNVLGGLIGNVVAGFYHSSGGYQRNVTFDKRMGEGLAPPLFPTTQKDTLKEVLFFSFGQREQVY